jgi:predicted nucleic acid-binding protein
VKITRDMRIAYNTLFMSTHGITLLPVDVSIARHSADLRAHYNLRTPDAIHVATAIEGQCDAFLTNDLGIKQVTEVRILVLDELEMP